MEDREFIYSHLPTLLGNKRKLVPFINDVLTDIRNYLSKEKMVTADLFAGSGVISRLLRQFSSKLYINDHQLFSYVINKGYHINKNEINTDNLQVVIDELNDKIETTLTQNPTHLYGFITELYAPKDENNITKDDRCFYTKENALRIDGYRRYIDKIVADPVYKTLLLAQLLVKASIHTNTCGTFKAFYKNRYTGLGQFGGTNQNALNRIQNPIRLEVPMLSNFQCDVYVSMLDLSNEFPSEEKFDLVYLDPPYNQHPYGSNYFMLNLIAEYKRPKSISKVSGIPMNWRRSLFNKKQYHKELLFKLIFNIKSRFVLLSYNNEGFISIDEMKSFISHWKHDVREIDYTVFRGGRNINKRATPSVTEYLIIIEKRSPRKFFTIF